MSISVTVNGNPVRIKRGKMVTADPDKSKAEFEKRRRMRLTQVRQQSDEIAAKVRKRVQKQREAQVSEIEKRGAEKLERWKVRKLMELQEQFCDSVKNLGLGHAQAAIEETREQVEEATRDLIKEKAKQRGFEAAKLLHQKDVGCREKEESIGRCGDGLKKPIKVIKSPFKKKKKKKKVKKWSTVDDKEESNLDFSVTEAGVPEIESSSSEEEKQCLISSPSSDNSNGDGHQKTNLVSSSQESSKNSSIRSPSPPKLADIIIHHPPDTRISERIRNRRLPSFTEPKFDDLIVKESDLIPPTESKSIVEEIPKCPCCCRCNYIWKNQEPLGKSVQTEKGNFKSIGTITEDHLGKCTVCNRKLNSNHEIDEIPSKPPIAVRNGSKLRNPTVASDKVQYYDHKNRFRKSYPTPHDQVKKIADCEIEVLPTSRSQDELIEKAQERDRAAQLRGKKAAEKEKIQKDYKELMRKLPALKKQERVAALNSKCSDKPEFHMNELRHKEQEQKKQCKMESCYEKLFPHRITIKPKPPKDDGKPFKVTESKGNSNAAPEGVYWDIERDRPNAGKDEESNAISNRVDAQPDCLKFLLDKLKKQKEMLMEEAESLPKDSNLNTILRDLEIMKQLEPNGFKAPPCSVNSDSSPKATQTPCNNKKTTVKSTGSSSEPKKHKKTCPKIQRVILQNTSTQTSPKVEISNQPPQKDELKSTETNTSPKIFCNKSSSCIDFERKNELESKQVSCKCDHNKDICKIVIKIQDDDEPDIQIKSPKLPKRLEMVSNKIDHSVNTDRPKVILKVPDKKPSITCRQNKFLENAFRCQKTNNSSPTTSTSYYSPPEPEKKLSLCNLTKCQRRALMVSYIKKLLAMSKDSVEKLPVSDTSSESKQSSISTDPALRMIEANLRDLQKQFEQSSTISSSGSEGFIPLSVEYDASTSKTNDDEDENEEVQLEDAAKKYQRMANMCQKRISNLVTMIDQVRKDREEILSPDKDPSTSYYKSPNYGQGSEGSSDREQEGLNKLLLDVNVTLDKLQEECDEICEKPSFLDPETYERYLNLMRDQEKMTQTSRPIALTESEAVQTTPMINIPKLPKLTTASNTIEVVKSKKPPIAKGLNAAKKFNGDIINIPHELSTIVEVESQLSTKVSPQLLEESTPDVVSESSSFNDLCNSSDQKKNDKSTSSDMENLEAMLVTMGMGWAVTTLRKTQETMTNVSASTSTEESKPKVTADSSTTDITLRDVLGKKIFSTTTDSSTRNSYSPLTKDFEDVSAIEGTHTRAASIARRTSTPIECTCLSEQVVRFQTNRTDGSSETSSKGVPSPEFRTLPANVNK